MYYVRIIDENGLFLRDEFVDELTEFTVEAPCPAGFYTPRWDGENWVEGGTPPETQIVPPTVEERLQAAESALLFLMEEA